MGRKAEHTQIKCKKQYNGKRNKMRNYQCLICKEKLRKYRNGRRTIFVPKHLLLWMIDWESEEQVIEHIKKHHPKIYKKTMGK